MLVTTGAVNSTAALMIFITVRRGGQDGGIWGRKKREGERGRQKEGELNPRREFLMLLKNNLVL